MNKTRHEEIKDVLKYARELAEKSKGKINPKLLDQQVEPVEPCEGVDKEPTFFERYFLGIEKKSSYSKDAVFWLVHNKHNWFTKWFSKLYGYLCGIRYRLVRKRV